MLYLTIDRTEMKIYTLAVAGLLLLGNFACTSLSEGEVTMPPNPDINRRVVFGNGANEQLRRQMYEQSSEVNRKRNIEESNQNAPATAPPARRPMRAPNAPVDSTRHNVQVPVRHVVPAN